MYQFYIFPIFDRQQWDFTTMTFARGCTDVYQIAAAATHCRKITKGITSALGENFLLSYECWRIFWSFQDKTLYQKETQMVFLF